MKNQIKLFTVLAIVFFAANTFANEIGLTTKGMQLYAPTAKGSKSSGGGKAFEGKGSKQISIGVGLSSYIGAFASFGKFEFAFNGSSEATAVEALADGNILVVGNTELNGVTRINLTRLLSDGTFDNSFAANEGSTTFSFLAGGERCDDMVMLNGSRMATVCSVVGVGQSDMFVTMFLLDLSVGLVDADMASNQILVYPNPVLSDFQLKYDLPSDQALTITLTDMSGRVVHTWVSNEMNAAGEHQLTLQRPDNIVAGHYLLHIQDTRST